MRTTTCFKTCRARKLRPINRYSIRLTLRMAHTESVRDQYQKLAKDLVDISHLEGTSQR